jgi:ubiquinone/menaquinone biosynthesis C-methylase UbiE
MLQRTAYWVSQNARVGWFLAQYLAGRRIGRGGARRRPANASAPAASSAKGSASGLGVRELLADLRALLAQDLKNIEDGRYALPHDLVRDPREILQSAWRYFADLPAVVARSNSNAFDEVARARPDALARFPEYYRRNFHYQTDGYLSDHSAQIYDHQVEVLFMGSADAMRRQALMPLGAFLDGRRVAETQMLDIACGTGRFLTFVKDNYPRLPVVALDLSPNYLAEARTQLKPWSDVRFIQGLAEMLPFSDASFDVVSLVYLLHEVPDEIRRRILAEVSRVLRPGGRLILTDSLQHGDVPYFDVLIRNFPRSFHEPYYAGYARTDFIALGASVGLQHRSNVRAFLSKVITLDKA